MKLKVCGLKHIENISQLLDEVMPDYIGLITYDKSPRYMLGNLSLTLDTKSAKRVGVFVNESASFINKVIQDYRLDAIQLHGKETPDLCKAFKKSNVEVIKVFSVEDRLPIAEMKKYVDCADYFLLDTKTPQHGGSGRKFDWTILETYTFDKPFFLSGGISAEDIDTIKKLDISQLYALDINSKFETEPGLKDITQIKKFKEELFD